MTDLDVQQAVEAAGDTISPTFRRDLRSTLAAELAGEVPITEPPNSQRASSQRRGLWVGLVLIGVAAAAAVAVVVVNVDDKPTVLVPATDAPDTTVQEGDSTSAELIEQLTASRWVLSESSGAAAAVSALPFIDFLESSTGLTARFDACDQFAVVEHGEDAPMIGAQVRNCAEGTATWGVAPQVGDRMEISDQGTHIDLVASDGLQKFGYVRLDSLDRVVDSDAVVGRWSVGDTAPVTVIVDADGGLTIAGCQLEWTLAGPFSVTGEAGGPPACPTAGQNDDSRWLIAMFEAGPMAAHLNATTGRLTLSNERYVMQLATLHDAQLMARLGDHRWVLDSIGGEPFAGGLVPYASFGGEAFAIGFDGCNTYGLIGSLVGGTISSSVVESSTAGCDGLHSGFAPTNGDRLVMNADGLSFDLIHVDGTVRLGFTRGDRLGRTPTGNEEYGRWNLGDSPPSTLDFSDVGTMSFGSCEFGYSIGDQLTIDLPDEQKCVMNNLTDPASARLFDAVQAGPLDVMLSNDGVSYPTLYLANDELVFRLSKARPVLDPAGVTFSAGAVFGFSPASEVPVDEVLATVEAAYRPVDHDTGWFDVPLVTFEDGTQDCLTGGTHRVLWWGDVSMAFWRFDDGTEMLWAWSIGDKRVSHWGDRRESYTPVDPVPSGFTVDGGIGIGSPASQIDEVFGDRIGRADNPNGDGTVSYDSAGHNGWEFPPGRWGSASFLVENEVVTGIGAELMFC